ncbi:MAG: hypothetical protein NT062_35690 [Proteobacteria bacterium]|nr:hypothetical protein [Pseudomonadota bacterium]
MSRIVVLLGPQGPHPDIAEVLAEHGIKGRVALVRAGYQERETDDAAMIASLGVPAVNLQLHRRGVDVFRDDPTFTAGYQARQQRLRHMQSFYRVRLDKIEDAARTVSVRYVDPQLLEQEDKVSVDQFRHLDADHIERCDALRTAFEEQWKVAERPLIAKYRAEVKQLMEDSDALVISGGHIASLVNRLALFDVFGVATDKPIFAWSAGAMVLTERIVLFHDFPPYGSDIAQVLDEGFGLAPGIVVLPDPRRKLNLEARIGIQRFARRMAPLTCVAMDHGDRIVFTRGEITRADATRLDKSGDIEPNWSGAPVRYSTASMKWARGEHP